MKNLPFLFFWLLGIVWGSNFIFMKIVVEHIDSIQVVFYRVLFGFIPIFLYALYSKSLKISHLKYAFHFFVMSLLAAIIYFYGFVKGTSLLESGIAGALSGSIPIFSFILATIFLKDEKITKKSVAGLIIGFIGVFLISGVLNENIENTSLEGALCIILASLSVGASFIYAKKFIIPLKLKVEALTTYQLGFALVILSLVIDFDGINNIWNYKSNSIALILGLGVMGTGLAYIIYYYLIEKIGAIKASSITYIPPFVALIIGFFVGENIKFIDFISCVLILVGVFLINKRKA